MVVVLKTFVEHCVSLGLGHCRVFCRLVVSQTDVFHWTSPVVVCQRRNPACWMVHPIVVRRGENRQQSHFLFQFPEPAGEETALRLLPSQGQRSLIRSTGLRKPSQPAAQIRAGRVREMIVSELVALE